MTLGNHPAPHPISSVKSQTAARARYDAVPFFRVSQATPSIDVRPDENDMEIRDTGEYAHRRDTIRGAQDVFDAGSMTEAVLLACEHADRDARNKQQAMRYLENHCEGQHVAKVAEILSTRQMPINYSATVAVGQPGD